MNAREAIEKFHAGELEGIALMRVLIDHEPWLVPAAFVEGGVAPLVRGTDEQWYPAFTDRAALDAFEAESGASIETWLEVPGTAVFASLSPDLAGIDLNPLSAGAIHYRQHQLPQLRELAEGVVVERILAGRYDGEDAFARLLLYRGYRTLHRAISADGAQLVLAPDDRGRKLAAVFTAPDTLAAYLAFLADILDEQPQVLTLDGRALYQMLSGLTALDGIVFNCKGPIPPKAVALAFAEVVLDRGESS